MTATIIPFPIERARKSARLPFATAPIMDSRYEPYVIFALNDGVDPAHFVTWCAGKGIGFKRLRGCYKGQEEDSYIVNSRHWGLIMPVFCSQQESVLHLSPVHPSGFRQATLIPIRDTSQPIVPLGRWEYIGSKKPALDAWTYDPSQQAYWAARAP